MSKAEVGFKVKINLGYLVSEVKKSLSGLYISDKSNNISGVLSTLAF